MTGPSPGHISWKLVSGLDSVFGVHPGYRAAHAKGICCVGMFTATPYVSRVTRAAHMTGRPVMVTVRFSNGSGDPNTPDAAPVGRGMAVKFHLPGGESTDLLSITTPIFPARTPEDFIELTRALATKTDEAIEAFKKAHPDLQEALKLALEPEPIESYAGAVYWAVHAFRFANAQGQECFVRYSWQPEAGVDRAAKTGTKRRPADYLETELRNRIPKGPVRFTLHLQFAATGDDVNDPATAWPEDRLFVRAGTLALTDLVSDQGAGCEGLAFDPTHLTDGIACSGDPILNARPGAYFLSHKRRTSAGT